MLGDMENKENKMKNERKISIHYPDGYHGYGIDFYNLEDDNLCDFHIFSRENVRIFMGENSGELKYFYQSGFVSGYYNSNGYAFIEVWNALEYQDKFLELVLAFAKEFDAEII